MRTQNRIRTILILLAAGSFLPSMAHAQQLRDERIESLAPAFSRVPDELKSHGRQYKGFVYSPRLSISETYDSNVLAETDADNPKSDFYTSIQPDISIFKSFGRHSMGLRLSANIERFSENKTEDKEEGTVSAGINLEPYHDWLIPLRFYYRNKFQDRSTPKTVNLTVEPIHYERTRAEAALFKTFNRLTLGLKGIFTNVDFGNDTSRDTGLPVIYDDSSYQDYAVELKARYGLRRGVDEKPEHIIFADFILGEQDYKSRRFQTSTNSYTGENGDNSRIAALAGFETTYKGLLFANVYAGYTRYEYDSPTLENTDAFNFGADVQYNITPKTTLMLNAKRAVEQDNDFVQGFLQTGVETGLQYEILHDWYLNSAINYKSFEYFGQTREDSQIGANLGLKHYHSPYIESNLSIGYFTKDSNIAINEFDRFIIGLRLTGKL